MNNSIFILKIIKEPGEVIFKNKIKFLEIETHFYFCKKNKIYNENFSLLLWGNLVDFFLKLCRKGDYIIVEGLLSIYIKQSKASLKKKKIEINVLKIHPLF